MCYLIEFELFVPLAQICILDIYSLLTYETKPSILVTLEGDLDISNLTHRIEMFFKLRFRHGIRDILDNQPTHWWYVLYILLYLILS